jgi:DNA-binding transcriptional MerR regulator
VTVTSIEPGLRVAQLADAVGVRPDTIRYYERFGLIEPPPRTSGGYRRYSPDTVDRVRFIQGCQRFGLRLKEIAELLAVRDTGVCPCEPAEQFLRRHIDELDAELARLSALRGEMTRILSALPEGGCPDVAPGVWCPPLEKGNRR